MSLVATFDVETDSTPKNERRTGSGGAGAQRRRPLRHSLYLGGKADAKDYDKLVNRWKITHVLNVTPPKQTNIEAGVPNYFETKGAIRYQRIPIYDAPTSVAELDARHGETIVRFIARGLCHGNVLVHCSRGVSRSTSGVVLYLMAKRGYGYDDALELIRRRRPRACPIPAFEAWLRGREKVYRQQRQQQQGDQQQPTASNDANDNKKRKRIANGGTRESAVGPSLPPSRKAAIGPSTGPAAAAIGPSLPPNPKSKSIGPTAPPSAIGPALPPPAKHHANDDADTTTVLGPSPPPKTIGPALLPHTTKTAATKTKTSTTADSIVGPCLPPTKTIGPEPPPSDATKKDASVIGPALPP